MQKLNILETHTNQDSFVTVNVQHVLWFLILLMNALDVYYGDAPKLSDTGFYFNVYQNEDQCKRNEQQIQTSFVMSRQCISQGGFAKMKSKSQSVGYDKERNAVLVEEFEEPKCQGIFGCHFHFLI